MSAAAEIIWRSAASPTCVDRLAAMLEERVLHETRYAREVLQYEGFTDGEIEAACDELCLLPYWREVFPGEGEIEFWIVPPPGATLSFWRRGREYGLRKAEAIPSRTTTKTEEPAK